MTHPTTQTTVAVDNTLGTNAVAVQTVNRRSHVNVVHGTVPAGQSATVGPFPQDWDEDVQTVNA